MPDSFELGLIPERKMDWRTLASSYGFVVLLLLIIVNISLIWPDRLQLSQNYHVTELIPRPSLQPKALKLKTPKVSLHAKLLPPVLFAAPKLTVPRDIQRPKQQAEIAPPKVVMNNFTPTVLKVSGGARPALIVHTGEFGSSAAPTLNAPVQKVQTGGFGDPNGIKGDGKQNARLVAMNTGSFDLPQGPGQGNGSGGANGLKGMVASTGFGNGIANGGRGDGRSNGQGGGVQTGGFGTQSVAQATGMRPQLDSGPPTTPVQITFKPNPVYTEEAKNLKLEGEVLLEVMFGADGQLHVNRVVRGLGHGLDEAAVVAANKMRFKAALRNGIPTDSTAVVHVVFQLAY